jgi:hypothetical protein
MRLKKSIRANPQHSSDAELPGEGTEEAPEAIGRMRDVDSPSLEQIPTCQARKGSNGRLS